jgi:hypothetical protein
VFSSLPIVVSEVRAAPAAGGRIVVNFLRLTKGFGNALASRMRLDAMNRHVIQNAAGSVGGLTNVWVIACPVSRERLGRVMLKDNPGDLQPEVRLVF